MKVVIDTSIGFGLSHEAVMRYAELKGFKVDAKNPGFAFPDYYKDGKRWSPSSIERTDSALIQVLEELKEKASTTLAVIEIPDGTKFTIDGDRHGGSSGCGYDHQFIREKHRVWQIVHEEEGWKIIKEGFSTEFDTERQEGLTVYAEKNGEKIFPQNKEQAATETYVVNVLLRMIREREKN